MDNLLTEFDIFMLRLLSVQLTFSTLEKVQLAVTLKHDGKNDDKSELQIIEGRDRRASDFSMFSWKC
jgi:hypothetical protein